MKKISSEEIKEKINSVKWFLSFEIIPGVVSPGLFPFNASDYADMLGIPKKLDGMRALDIGTWDGPMAFELEKRGAKVVALDIHNPDNTGFNIAKELKQSQVAYVQGSVYDLTKLLKGAFDLVTFLGVYYHLKHPLLGFENIAHVLKMNGLMYFSGECFISYAETLTGESMSDVENFASSEVPIALAYPGVYKNQGNWFIPNIACIKSWMIATGFEFKNYSIVHDPKATPCPVQRISCKAKKNKATPITGHPLVGIDFFKRDDKKD
jgi:tRNA (mo5U34)-methyltransferase